VLLLLNEYPTSHLTIHGLHTIAIAYCPLSEQQLGFLLNNFISRQLFLFSLLLLNSSQCTFCVRARILSPNTVKTQWGYCCNIRLKDSCSV